MSSSDWRRWCNESQHRELKSSLTALDGWSFTAITVYALAALVAAFFWLRWFQLTAAHKALIWPGFKWYAFPRRDAFALQQPCRDTIARPSLPLPHRFTALMAAGCVFGCLSNVSFRGAMQYLFLMYDTGVFSGAAQGDKALAAEYFGYLDNWWCGQIVLHALELAVNTYADLQVLIAACGGQRALRKPAADVIVA